MLFTTQDQKQAVDVLLAVAEISDAAERGVIAEVPGQAIAGLVDPNCIVVAVQPAPGLIFDYCLN